MKKLITSILTLTLVSSVSATAVAADSDTNNGSNSTNITVSSNYQDSSTDVISVELAWDSMDFTYTVEGGTWNPETHSMTPSDAAGSWTWDGATTEKSAPVITAANHSKSGVKVNFAFTSSVDGLTGSFTGLTDGALTLATAENTDPTNAPSGSTSFSISGSGINENTSLGTITVNVTKNAEDSGDSDGVIKVSTGEELIETLDALQDPYETKDNQTIQLDSDITLNKKITIVGEYIGKGTVIDLNGHTINISDELAQGRVPLILIGYCEDFPITIKNGTLHMERPMLSGKNYPSDCLTFVMGGTTIFENCTFYGDKAGIANVNGSTVTFRNCTFNFDPINNGGFVTFNDNSNPSNIIFSGNTSVSHILFIYNQVGTSRATVTCLAGTYNFDPTEYVDTSDFTITKDGNIWTVTNK